MAWKSAPVAPILRRLRTRKRAPTRSCGSGTREGGGARGRRGSVECVLVVGTLPPGLSALHIVGGVGASLVLVSARNLRDPRLKKLIS